MEICFELDPLDQIEPWGEGDQRNLHWFGLTSGRYWISTPLGETLRYTDEQAKAWKLTSPYVDYQIARIFEDLQSILPEVLEPVPPDVAAMVADDRWYLRFEDWIEGSSDEEKRRYLSYDVMSWYQERSLDTMYLKNGPLFRLWRTGDAVQVRWQTGSSAVGLWTTPEGHFAIDAEQFKSAAYEFLDEVLRAMQERVDGIQANGWHRDDCRLDIPLLVEDQKNRAAQVEELKQRSATTDWESIRSLMKHLPKQFFE